MINYLKKQVNVYWNLLWRCMKHCLARIWASFSDDVGETHVFGMMWLQLVTVWRDYPLARDDRLWSVRIKKWQNTVQCFFLIRTFEICNFHRKLSCCGFKWKGHQRPRSTKRCWHSMKVAVDHPVPWHSLISVESQLSGIGHILEKNLQVAVCWIVYRCLWKSERRDSLSFYQRLAVAQTY